MNSRADLDALEKSKYSCQELNYNSCCPACSPVTTKSMLSSETYHQYSNACPVLITRYFL